MRKELPSYWTEANRAEWPPKMQRAYPDWHVATEKLRYEGKTIRIETDYLGWWHRFGASDKAGVMSHAEVPTWETMVFGGPEELDQAVWRWDTAEDATVGHPLVVAAVRRYLHEQESALRTLRSRSLISWLDPKAREHLSRAIDLLKEHGLERPDYFDLSNSFV